MQAPRVCRLQAGAVGCNGSGRIHWARKDPARRGLFLWPPVSPDLMCLDVSLFSMRTLYQIACNPLKTNRLLYLNQSVPSCKHFPLFSLQNAVYFIMLPCLVPVLFTF
jgi:hypothetical protein